MRRGVRVAAGLAVAAGAAVFFWGWGRSSIHDQSQAQPAGRGDVFGHAVLPRGTYRTAIGTGAVHVEAELGTRDAAGAFVPRRDTKRVGMTFAGVGGVPCWTANTYGGLPVGTYVVKATLFANGGVDDEPRELAVCYSKPLTLP